MILLRFDIDDGLFRRLEYLMGSADEGMILVLGAFNFALLYGVLRLLISLFLGFICIFYGLFCVAVCWRSRI